MSRFRHAVAALAASCSWTTVRCSCGASCRVEYHDGLTLDDVPESSRAHATTAQGGAGFFALIPCDSPRPAESEGVAAPGPGTSSPGAPESRPRFPVHWPGPSRPRTS
jgi:hypothetical protein